MRQRIDAALVASEQCLRCFEDRYFNALTPLAFWNSEDPEIARDVEAIRGHLDAIADLVGRTQTRLASGSLAYPVVAARPAPAPAPAPEAQAEHSA